MTPGPSPRDDRPVALTFTTDHAAIGALVDPLLAADPVRGTVLGTVRTGLTATAWAAGAPDGRCLAVRGDATFPVLVLAAADDPVLRELARVLDALTDLTGLSGPADTVGRLAATLTAGGRRRIDVRSPQRLFRLDTLVPPTVPGRAVLATAADRGLVDDWYLRFAEEAGTGTADILAASRRAIDDGCRLWLDPDDRPVSLAARRPVVAGSARIGPVYTPPEQRGHGYGSAVTAAATRDVLAEDAVPVLFTDLGNPVSNAIYPRLGYRPVEDRLVVRFA